MVWTRNNDVVFFIRELEAAGIAYACTLTHGNEITGRRNLLSSTHFASSMASLPQHAYGGLPGLRVNGNSPAHHPWRPSLGLIRHAVIHLSQLGFSPQCVVDPQHLDLGASSLGRWRWRSRVSESEADGITIRSGSTFLIQWSQSPQVFIPCRTSPYSETQS